jgi:hypothetical protein
VERCRMAAVATAQPEKIRIKVPMSSATAEPSMFEASIRLPYKPCICPRVEPLPEPRFKIRLATCLAAPDRPPPVCERRL